MAVANTEEIVGYVSGLINSANWTTIDDVTINSSDATITSESANFTQNDVGSYFSIAGGAGTNRPLLGYITSVTSESTAEMSVNAGASMTSARMQYGGKTDDPRHPLWKITKAVLQKDIEVCHAILRTKNHPRRNFFTFSAATPRENADSGLSVPSHSGELLKVEILHSDNKWRVAKQLPESWLPKLLRWQHNRGSIFSAASEGYYIISGGNFFFTGTKIKETYADLTISTLCQAPSEYSSAIALLACADLFSTEGDDLAATGTLAQLGAASAAELIGREVAG